MHPCMYELSMFVVVAYKHVFRVSHIINGVELHKALFKVGSIGNIGMTIV